MVVFSGVSLSIVGILTLLTLGGGMPLGLPPAAEDPVLFQLAPEECLYYVTWAGRAAPDPSSANRTEQLLAHPDLQGLATELLTRFRTSPAVRDEEAAQFAASLVSASLASWWTQPTAVWVERLDPRDPNQIKAGAVIKLPPGNAGMPVAELLNQLSQRLGAAVEDFESAGTTFQRVQPPSGRPAVAWGVHQGYLCCGIGESVIEELLPRMATPPPTWLSALRAECTVERRASLAHLDAKAVVARIRAAGDAAWLVESGLDAVGGMTFATGLEGEGFVSRTWITWDRQPGGVAGRLGMQPLAPDGLAHIPADATIAVAARAEVAELLTALVSLAATWNPRAEQTYEQFLDQWQQAFGFHLRDELLPCLGDVWTLHAAPSEGGLITGWTWTVTLRDGARLAALNNMLAARFSGALGDGEPRVKTSVAAGNSWSTFHVPDDDLPIAPSWCLTDRHLVFALFPQAIKAHLERGPGDPALIATRAITTAFAEETQPAKIVYVDARSVLRIVYPWLQILAQRFLAEQQRQGLDLDVGLLPSLASMEKNLQPSVATWRTTPRGWLFESRQTLPGGNPGTTAPMAAAALLPALQASREAAQRAQGMNNLKQILLALLNHESATQTFPAAFSADRQGQPLLSWRVHILPFIEEQQLYEEFHLDEPWDSPHNRQLIPRMPRVYVAPGSQADPGKTNYLGVRGPRGVLQPPEADQSGKPRPAGTRIRDIRDGTSNTICVVEASDELAVIWTKPDDYEPPADGDAKGLSGLRVGGFLAGFVDGHVSFISQQVDPAVLQALFTRDGGEVVNEPY